MNMKKMCLLILGCSFLFNNCYISAALHPLILRKRPELDPSNPLAGRADYMYRYIKENAFDNYVPKIGDYDNNSNFILDYQVVFILLVQEAITKKTIFTPTESNLLIQYATRATQDTKARNSNPMVEAELFVLMLKEYEKYTEQLKSYPKYNNALSELTTLTEIIQNALKERKKHYIDFYDDLITQTETNQARSPQPRHAQRGQSSHRGAYRGRGGARGGRRR